MGIDLGNLSLDEATTMVKFGGQEAKIKYRPSIITTKRLNKIKASIEDEDVDAFITFLLETVIEWDVTKDGEMFPLEFDAMSDLPMAFIRATYLAIMGDAGQGEADVPSGVG